MPISYTCPECSAISFSPNDNLFCAHCHRRETGRMQTMDPTTTQRMETLVTAIAVALTPVGYRGVIEDLTIHDPVQAEQLLNDLDIGLCG